MAVRQIGHRKSSLVPSARFPVVKWRSRSVAKSAYSNAVWRALNELMLIWSWRRARFKWILGHVCIIPYSFCAGTKTKPFRIEHLFTHTNGDFGAISAMERRCAAPILKAESHIPDRFSHYIKKLFLSARKSIRYSVNRVWKRLGHQNFLTSLIWASQSSVCSN